MRPLRLCLVPYILLALALGIGLAGCRTSETSSPTVVPSPTPSRTPTRTVAPVPTPTTTPSSSVITLTWWLPEFLSPKAPQPAGPMLAGYLTDFAAATGGKVQVLPVVKARTGKGSVLDYLRTAPPVAPAILPDIVALDVGDLEQVAALKLLQPLDALLPAQTLAGLYPFARSAGRFNNQQLAVQLIADIEHVAYNRSIVVEPPQTWAGLAAQRIFYAFPLVHATAPTGAMDDLEPGFIGQYLSAGATFDPQTRHLTVQEQPLLRVLTFYGEARAAGRLPDAFLRATDDGQTWTTFAGGQAQMVLISARRYLLARDTLKDVSFAAPPGWSAPAPAPASGWALAVITSDPVRQRAAADLIAWLLGPERLGPWSQATGWLPTSPAALATWGATPYHEFLDQRLAQAVSRPIGSDYPQVASRINRAIAAVLQGTSSPAEATQAALGPPK